MKKCFTLLFSFVLLLFVQKSYAQCSIDTSIHTDGFTPDSLPCVMQGATIGQVVQVHVPAQITASGFTVTVDSVLLTSVTGLPNGITVSGVPASGVLPGNSNGCLWFSGRTNDPIGHYTPQFHVTVWYSLAFPPISDQLDTVLSSWGYNFGFDVCTNPNPVPFPAFSANTLSGCGSLTTSFTDASANSPTSWKWTFAGGNPPSSTQQNPTVNYSSPGSYDVKLVATNGNGSDSITQVGYVNVYPNPALSIQTNDASTSSAADGSATVTITSGTSPYTILWSNGQTSATDTSLVHGSYSVTVTDAHNCQNTDSATVSFNVGIQPVGAVKQVKIYPNPAYDQLNLEWTLHTEAEVSIIDITGKSVKHFVVAGALLNTFDIHDIATGSYTVRITDKQTKEVQSVRFTKF
jgi:PKD repeat protein